MCYITDVYLIAYNSIEHNQIIPNKNRLVKRFSKKFFFGYGCASNHCVSSDSTPCVSTSPFCVSKP